MKKIKYLLSILIFLSLINMTSFANKNEIGAEGRKTAEELSEGINWELPTVLFEENPRPGVRAWGRDQHATKNTVPWILFDDGHLVIYVGEVLGSVGSDNLWVRPAIRDEVKVLTAGVSHPKLAANIKLKFLFNQLDSFCKLFSNIEEVKFTNKVDTLGAKSAKYMFQNNKKLKKVDLGSISMSKMENISGMFRGTASLESLDVSDWDVSQVMLMSNLFYGASSLKELDVSRWNTSRLVRADNLFRDTNVEKLEVGNWDTSKITDMQSMFGESRNIKELDVSKWDTSRVELMRGTFSGTENLKELDISKWDVSKVTDMMHMFNGASSLEKLDVSKWDVSEVTNMSWTFCETSSLGALDVSKWDTSNIRLMNGMFDGSSKIEKLDVSKWNTAKLEDTSEAFEGMSNLKELDVSKWNVGKLNNARGMFKDTIALEVLDVSNWNTSSLENSSSMFEGMTKVKLLDVSNWDMSNVIRAGDMFKDAVSLEIADVSKWNTSKMQTPGGMFDGAIKLKEIDVSNWDGKIFTVLDYMFRNVTVENVDISKWGTGKHLMSFNGFFEGASNVKVIDFSDWIANKSENIIMKDAFKNASSVKTLDLSMFNNSINHRNMLEGTNLDSITLGINTKIKDSNLSPISKHEYWKQVDGKNSYGNSIGFIYGYQPFEDHVGTYIRAPRLIPIEIYYVKKGTPPDLVDRVQNQLDYMKKVELDPRVGINSRAKGLVNGYGYMYNTDVYIGKYNKFLINIKDGIKSPVGDLILKDESLYDKIDYGVVLKVIHYYN